MCPCWEVLRYSVDFKAENIDLLKKALDALGWGYNINDYILTISGGIVIDLKNEKANISDYQADKLNRLKQEYSWQAVQEVAKKKKWYVKSKGARKYQVRRY